MGNARSKRMDPCSRSDEGDTGKKVIYNNDGYTDFFSGSRKTAEDIRKYDVDIFIGQDVEQIDYSLGVTFMLEYNSKYAGAPFEESEQYDYLMRDGDKLIRRSVRSIIAETGKAPIQIAADRAYEVGLKVNASLRMEAFYDMCDSPWLNGKIYSDFCDCRVIDREGQQQNQISYAYPKMQEFIRNVLKEVTSFDNVNGVNLDFCRYPYIIGYEPVVADAYKDKYGVDPKQETAADGLDKWYRFRADIITQFMKEVRKDLINKSISVRVPYSGYLEYGLDIEKWVEDELIDMLIPSSIGNEEFYDAKPFADMVKGSGVKLYGGINADLAGHDLTKEEDDMIKNGIPVDLGTVVLNTRQYQERAYELYQAGCEGLYIFNNWNAIGSLGLLGDKAAVEKWYKANIR